MSETTNNNNLPTTETPILDIRFILLKSAIVSEIISKNMNALGYFENSIDEGAGQYVLDLLRMDYQIWYPHEPQNFGTIQNLLDHFAGNGAFFSTENSLRKITKLKDSDNTVKIDSEFGRVLVTENELETLERLFEQPLPIYAPRKFRSEWTRSNKLETKTDVEIWRFKMWRNNEKTVSRRSV